MADVPITGIAVVDVNGNGKSDSADLPLEGAKLIILSAGGRQWTETTDSKGIAFTEVGIYNDAGISAFFPVTLRMEPPGANSYTPIGLTEVTRGCCSAFAEFLFATPATSPLASPVHQTSTETPIP